MTISTDQNKYSGNHFLTATGIFVYGFLIISIAFSIAFSSLGLFYGLVTFLFIFYLATGLKMYYFHLEGKNLLVKNHFWFWINKEVDLNLVKEISFERPYNRPKTIRLIFKDNKTKSYPASSLRKDTWTRFMENLGKEGIKLNSKF